MTPNDQSLERMPARCLYPGELLEILWQFKHPRVNTLGVNRNRFGERTRSDCGFQVPCGTFYWATPREREDLCLLPADCIPYAPVREGGIDPITTKWQGEVVRGWRGFLSDLLKQGIIRHDDELSYLIGEDSCLRQPKEFRRI